MKATIIFCVEIFVNSGDAQSPIAGSVFLDKNRKRIKDDGEVGMMDVLDSNGRDVVKTDKKGEWSIADNDNSLLLIIQPTGYPVPSNE